MEKLEHLLAIWVDDMWQHDDSPMTNIALQEKALSLNEDLRKKQGEGCKQQTFIASRG